jgi:hypothetical protein
MIVEGNTGEKTLNLLTDIVDHHVRVEVDLLREEEESGLHRHLRRSCAKKLNFFQYMMQR